MKATQSQILELVKALGVEDVEVVDDESKSDFALEAALTSVDASRGEVLRPTWEREHVSRIETDERGKVAGSLRTALAREFGLDPKVFTKEMTYPQMVKYAKEEYSKTLGATQEEFQKKLDEVGTSKENEWKEKLSPIEKERDQWKDKYTSRARREALAKHLEKAPLPPKYSKLTASEDLDTHLANKYHVVVNETTGDIELYDKANPTIPATVNGQKVKVLDEAKSYFEPRNNWLTDTRTADPAAATNGNANKGFATQQQFQQQQQNGNEPLTYQQQLQQATAQMAQDAGLK